MIAAVALAASLLTTEAPPPFLPAADPHPAFSLAPSAAGFGEPRSAWGALGLSALCEAPTLLVGPSCGHLYAGEEAHFFFTGGLRALDFLGLALLEKWGPGAGPLYAVVQPHFSRSLAAYPFAYPLDLVLVALWWGTGLYDLVDSFFAAKRHDRRPAFALPLSRSDARIDSGAALARF